MASKSSNFLSVLSSDEKTLTSVIFVLDAVIHLPTRSSSRARGDFAMRVSVLRDFVRDP